MGREYRAPPDTSLHPSHLILQLLSNQPNYTTRKPNDIIIPAPQNAAENGLSIANYTEHESPGFWSSIYPPISSWTFLAWAWVPVSLFQMWRRSGRILSLEKQVVALQADHDRIEERTASLTKRLAALRAPIDRIKERIVTLKQVMAQLIPPFQKRLADLEGRIDHIKERVLSLKSRATGRSDTRVLHLGNLSTSLEARFYRIRERITRNRRVVGILEWIMDDCDNYSQSISQDLGTTTMSNE